MCLLPYFDLYQLIFFGEQVQRTVNQSIALERAGRVDQIPEGWVTPDGTLFIPGKPTVLQV